MASPSVICTCQRYGSLLATVALAAAVAMPVSLEARKGQPERTRFSKLFDASSPIGPVYYPAHAGEKDPERLAAVDLGRYLEQISGQRWEVLPEPGGILRKGIFVGKTRRAFVDGLWRAPNPNAPAQLPTDRIHTKVNNRTVMIVGETPTATRAAVYQFLQHYTGAEWYGPETIGEEIPSLDSLKLPQKHSAYQPSFRDRQFHVGGSSAEYRDWMHRLGASNHFNSNHNLHRIFTPELHAEHPEYWAEVNGKRSGPTPGRGERSSQLDFTQPDVARLSAEFAQEIFDSQPHRNTFSLGINDTIDFGNDEATLAALAPQRYWRGHPVHSNLVMGFANSVAERLGQSHPDRYLTVLAYMWAEALPDFPLLPNLFAYLCIDRAQWYDPERRASDLELTKAWANSGAGELGAWEYYQGEGYFIPRIFTTITAASLKALHEDGYRSLFFENGRNTGFDVPKMWLAARLAWDVNADADALLHQFYTGYYGAAAAPMEAFFAYCEQIWMNQQGHAFWLKYFLDPAQAELFTPARLAHLQALLDQARATLDTAHAPERFYQRLELTETAFAYLKAAASYYHLYRNLVTMPLHSAAQVADFERTYAAFEQARTELEKAPQPQNVRQHWELRQQLLWLHPLSRLGAAYWGLGPDSTPPAPVAGSTLIPSAERNATLLLRETFSQPVIENDTQGIGPRPPRPEENRNGWNIRWTHHENASLTRSPLPARTHSTSATTTTSLVNATSTANTTSTASASETAHSTPQQEDQPASQLTLRNHEFFSIYRWVALPEGASHIGIRLRVRGEVAQGTRVQTSISWMSTEHKRLGEPEYNILPPGNYPGWQFLAIGGAVPEGARWVYLGMRVQYQAPQTVLDLSQWEVFYW